MLPVPWLNACIPKTQYLSDGSLAAWRQTDQGLGLTKSMKASKQPLNGYMGERSSGLSCSRGWVKGKVRVSACLSVLGKLRVIDKQQVREGQWVESSLRGMLLRSGVGVQALAPCKCSLLGNQPG